MKILLIIAHDRYRECAVKNYHDLINYYINNSKNDIKYFYTDIRFHTKIYKLLKYWKPELIGFFDVDIIRFGEKFDYLFNKNIPVYSVSEDMHWGFEKMKKCLYINKCFSLIKFDKSIKIINEYQNYFKDKYITYFDSRFLNMKKFKNYNLEKKYDILIYGNRRYSVYPLRGYLNDILIKYQNKYKIKILRNSGSFSANKRKLPINEELSKLINQSYLTVASSSVKDVLLQKYIEISASYSCILGNIPSDYKNLFTGNIIEININMTEKEIIDIIDKALSNKKKLLEMTNRLHEIIIKEHNLDCGVKNFDKVFENILYKYNINNK